MAETKLNKWGNSQGVLIPKSICKSSGLEVGDLVSIGINPRNHKIEITRAGDVERGARKRLREPRGLKD